MLIWPSFGMESLVDLERTDLFKELRAAGFGRSAIRSAWPSWWDEAAAGSASSRSELRFALARKLGISAKALIGERVEFVWDDRTKFKSLSLQDDDQKRNAISAFGVSIGRILLEATTPVTNLSGLFAIDLRNAILSQRRFVDLSSLITLCWGVGVPIISLRVLPLETKSMHAMVVSSNGRFAILLARDAHYPALVSFTIAHEIGHIALQHLEGSRGLVDIEDPTKAQSKDDEEVQADQFALTLLTGSPEPDIKTNVLSFNAPSLAEAVLRTAPQYNIEPGTLALCLAFRRKNWAVTMSAMQFIYSEKKPVWKEINGVADHQLKWDLISFDNAEYLRTIMNGESY